MHEHYFGSPVLLGLERIFWEYTVIDQFEILSRMDIQKQAIWAIKSRHISLLKYLINKKVDLQFHKQTPPSSSPLYLAASHGDPQIVQTLLDAKCDPNEMAENESSPLYVAAQEGHLEVCKILIENGANIDYSFREGYFWYFREIFTKPADIRPCILQLNVCFTRIFVSLSA